MTRRATFTAASLSRALSVAAKHGYEVRVEGDAIRFLPAVAKAAEAATPLDAELAEWAQKHGYG